MTTEMYVVTREEVRGGRDSKRGGADDTPDGTRQRLRGRPAGRQMVAEVGSRHADDPMGYVLQRGGLAVTVDVAGPWSPSDSPTRSGGRLTSAPGIGEEDRRRRDQRGWHPDVRVGRDRL